MSVIIVFPTQIDTVQEIIKQESMHPCQQNQIDMINFENNLDQEKKYSQSEGAIINYEWRELTKKSDECGKYAEEWRTKEFIEKIQALYDKES